MQTSCPACRTTFRVTQAQLGLRRGLVRCGTCNAVFNAYDALLPELDPAPATTPGSSPSFRETPLPAQPSTPPGRELEADLLSGFPPPSLTPVHSAELSPGFAAAGLFEVRPSQTWSEEPASDIPTAATASEGTATTADTEMAKALEPSTEIERQTGTEPRTEPTAELDATSTLATVPRLAAYAPDSAEAILLSELPNRAKSSPDSSGPAALPGWKRVLHGLLIVLLAPALFAQLAYFFRAEVAKAVPASRPALEGACELLGCIVPLPAQLTREAIVSSSLEHDPEQKSRVRLSFLLANRTETLQAWPYMVLTLSDIRENPVAQKVFAPKDYLPRTLSDRSGFAAQSEQEANIELDLGTLVAASYVLNLKYP